MTAKRTHATVRVLVVSPQPLLADGIRQALTDAGAVVTVVASASAALDAVATTRPAVVITADQLGDGPGEMSGLELLGALHREAPAVRTMLLTATPSPALVGAALGAGALGVVSLRATGAELWEAVTGVLDGRVSLDRHAGSALAGHLIHPAPDTAGLRLTQAERRVLRLMGDGISSTTALCERLMVTPSTARAHVNAVIVKLGVHSKAEAIAAALRLGLIEPAA